MFSRYNAFKGTQNRIALPVIAELVSSGGFNEDVRDQLLTSFSGRANSDISEILHGDLVTKLSRYAGSRLIQIAVGNPTNCYKLDNLLRILEALSPEAELVYASRALQKLSGKGEIEKKECKAPLENSVSGRRPTDEMNQKWLDQLSSGVTDARSY